MHIRLFPSVFATLVTFFAIAAHAETLTINSDSGPVAFYSDSRALLIGAIDYESVQAWPRLDQVEVEIDKVETALKSHGFTIEKIVNPTGTMLGDKLKKFLLRKSDKNTRLLVYFAGHGWTDGDSIGYIVPVDSPAENDDNFVPSLINLEEIVGLGRRAKTKHLMFVFNSCFSGSVLAVRKNLVPTTSSVYLNDIDRLGRQYITAGGAREAVPDISDFADAFIAGLNGDADVNKDQIVTGSELGPFIRQALIPGGKQTPQYGTDPDFRFKLGDMVFLPKSLLNSTMIQIAAAQSGPRISALRGLGEPIDEAVGAFKGIEILYYQRSFDGEKVITALDSANIPYVVTRAQLAEKFRVNALVCGPDVPVDAVKQLASTLSAAGVPIRRIMSFKNPSEKPRRIEIMSMTKNAAGTAPISNPPLTLEQIDGLTECPRLLENPV